MEKKKSSVEPAVPAPLQKGKEMDSDVVPEVPKLSENYIASRTRGQRARRERELELSCGSIKKLKTITSDSILEQQTGNNTPSKTDTEKVELVVEKEDHSSCEVKNTNVQGKKTDVVVEISKVSEENISSRVLPQCARRARECEFICKSVKKSKTTSNSALEQENSNRNSSMGACSQETAENYPSNGACLQKTTNMDKGEIPSGSSAIHMERENSLVDPSQDPSVPVSTSLEQEKQMDIDVIVDMSKVSEKHISSRVLAQRARRKRERELSCESVKKSKITSSSALEQQTNNNTPSKAVCSKATASGFSPNIASTHAQTDIEKNELVKKNGHLNSEVKNMVEKTDMVKSLDESIVNEKKLKRILSQRARREREKKELQLKKLSVSSSALEQQTDNTTPSNTVCSQETAREFPTNIASTHAQTDIEKDELVKKKDHSNSEVKNTVQKTDMDKIVEESTVNEKKLKRMLSQRARREREKKKLQLKKPNVCSSAVKNMVGCHKIKQHLPFLPNSTARDGLSAVPAAPSPSQCHTHEKNPVTRQQPTSMEPNQRPSPLHPSGSFTLRQPPIRVHHFITSRNQINMNRNLLHSFDTSSVMKHIRMVQGMHGMKKRYPGTAASMFKMDVGKCSVDPPAKPANPPKDEICHQPSGGNLPLSTPQIHLTGKQSSLEHPTVSTFREKVFAAVRKTLSRRQISQRNRREREKAEAAAKRRPVRYSKQSLAQRARRKREKEQVGIASSSTCSLAAEEQCNQKGVEKMEPQGSSLHIHAPNKGVSSELCSSIPAEHLTSAVCVNSPPRSSVLQGSNLHILPPNKGVSNEHLTTAVCANISSQTSVSQGSNFHILPPNEGGSSKLGSSIPAEHLTSAVCVNPPPQNLVPQGTSRESERAEATRHSIPVLPSRRSRGQRARREKQRQQAAMASSSTCFLPAEEQGNSTQKQFEKRVSQGSCLPLLPPNKGVNSELDSSIPAKHLTSTVFVNSLPQGSVLQGSNLPILPPNKGTSSELGTSIPAKHFASVVGVNSPPRSSVSQGSTLHIRPPNIGVSSELGSSIPVEHLTSAVCVNPPPRSSAGGTTASSVHTGLRPDNLISGDASSPVNIYSLGKSGVMRFTSPSANVGFGKDCRGSKIGCVSSQSLSSLRASSGTAYPSSSSHGPASASADMTKRTLGTERSSGTGRITQPWLSPLTNRTLLPQLAKSCKMRVFTDSNYNGKKWRPGGNPFKGKKELSVGVETEIKSSNASQTKAQGNSALNLVQKKGLQESNLQSFAANPARNLPGGPTASSVPSGLGPDNLTSGDASSLVNVCSLKRAESVRVSSPSANMGLGKGIDRSCKFGSVASQSLSRVHMSPGIAFPSPRACGPASAAPDMVNTTLGTDQSGSGGITQPLLSTRSNGILLPQLGGSCTATGLNNSNSDGKQGRPSGSSFTHPTEMVQQRIDSTLDIHGAANSDKCSTGHKEEEPKKKASSDLKNDNLNAVLSSPGKSILEDSRTIADATMVSALNLSISESPQSLILNQNVHVENEHLVCTNKTSEELHKSKNKTNCMQEDPQVQPSPLLQTQTDKSNKESFSSPPIKSLTEHSSSLNHCENTSGVSHPGGFRKTDEEYWKERFSRLQDRLKRCDDTSDEEYIQRIQYSSPDAGGGHTLELKGRTMKLLLEEGHELMRVKHLNVLGNSAVPLTKPLETENGVAD